MVAGFRTIGCRRAKGANLKPPNRRGTPLPPDLVARARALVQRVGLNQAATLLGLSVNGLRQGLAGLSVINGTRLTIEVGLARLPVETDGVRAR
jgi:hypothetical protein